jgi:hypothetical protein
MHVPAPCEAVDLTFVGVDDVGELVPARDADEIHDGPSPSTNSDVGDPVDVVDGHHSEILLGGVRGEDELGHPPALIDQR